MIPVLTANKDPSILMLKFDTKFAHLSDRGKVWGEPHTDRERDIERAKLKCFN